MGKSNSKIDPMILDELIKDTRFSKNEIRKWYLKFHHDFGEVCSVNILVENYGHTLLGNAERFITLVFNKFDSDGDGNIDFKEFMTALDIIKNGTMNEVLTWTFHIYDLDGDELISKNELLLIIESIFAMVGCSDLTPEEKVEQILRRMDKNDDGYLSLDEFIQGARNDPIITYSMRQGCANLRLD